MKFSISDPNLKLKPVWKVVPPTFFAATPVKAIIKTVGISGLSLSVPSLRILSIHCDVVFIK